MSVVFFNTTEGEVETESSSSMPANSSNQQLNQSEAQQSLSNFWHKVTEDIRKIGTVNPLDLKNQALPLARIKKIMKLDDDVKMISAEAPMLFAKAAEIFIHELTLRAWIHTEDNKRRTLQRNDIAMAITKFDQFDFLIDIVPRDEIKPSKSRDETTVRTSMNPDQTQIPHKPAIRRLGRLFFTETNNRTGTLHLPTVWSVPRRHRLVQRCRGAGSVHYYFQLAQQHQAALQQNAQQTSSAPQATTVPTIQIVQPSTGQLQTVNVASHTIEQIQLTQQQLQMIRMQMQGGTNQPIIIQTAPIQAIQQTSAQPQIIQTVNLTAEDPLGGTPGSQM
uniref:Nuclear transcription factor Y subunit gamma n=1 Tax=Timema bartmani TaxID=61472 RepID=A0A7R9HZC8_9NEOP|nr:unnamed protein product [Timema bartmani]